MRFFVTGATGFVGTAVVKELLSHDHQVLGLSRSEKGDKQLKDAGATPLRGTIEDAEVLKQGASECDVVLHLAFNHGVTDFPKACQTDQAAISILGNALIDAGGDRALVVTSGTMLLTPGVIGDEDSPKNLQSPIARARGPAEEVCLEFTKRGLRASVVRLPPVTYGPGFSGFMGHYIGMVVTKKGVAPYIEGRLATWSAGHRDDAAVLYRLAGEKGGSGGAIYHATAEQGVAVKDIAEVVAGELGVRTRGIPVNEVEDYFSWFQFAALAQNLASSDKTQKALGWKPSQPGLIESMPAIIAGIKAQGGVTQG